MAVFSWIQQWRGTPRLNDVSGQIVRKIYVQIRDEVEPRALRMCRAEARGYVRAKSAPLVRAEVTNAVATVQGLGGWAADQLLKQTIDRLVETLVTDILWTKVLPGQRRKAA